MLQQMAVADAYALAFEFVEAPFWANDLTKYYQHPKYPLKKSWYSDDTQRAIANAEAIISGKDLEDPATWIASLQQTYKTSPRPGYSKRFQAFLKAHLESNADTWLSDIVPRSSNGGIMGIAPLGVLEFDAINPAVATVVQITHAADTVIWGQAIAHATHGLIHGLFEHKDIHSYLSDVLPGFAHVCPQLGLETPVAMSAQSSAKVALTLAQNNNSLQQILKQAVDLKGDTDSVAAIAISMCADSIQYHNDLPLNLLDKLEDGDEARKALVRDTDIRLMTMQMKRDHASRTMPGPDKSADKKLSTEEILQLLRKAEEVVPLGSLWEHYKGGFYRVIGHGLSSRDGRIEAQYQREAGPGYDAEIEIEIVHHRPIAEWNDNIEGKPRMTRVDKLGVRPVES